jgi:nucleotide-binding universal stress UspA family protein
MPFSGKVQFRVADWTTQHATSSGVDAFCMATHGWSGLSEILLGSHAVQVAKRSVKPVLLVPPEHEA